MTEANPSEIENLAFADLIRLGNDKGLLLSEVQQWKRYRQERGITSHTYDEMKAQEVFEHIPAFLQEAQFLLKQLHERISQ